MITLKLTSELENASRINFCLLKEICWITRSVFCSAIRPLVFHGVRDIFTLDSLSWLSYSGGYLDADYN